MSIPEFVESDVLDGAEPDHGIVDSSDDEGEFEEEPATQKGQGIDNTRANCASHEPAVPTDIGDESLADKTPRVRHLALPTLARGDLWTHVVVGRAELGVMDMGKGQPKFVASRPQT